VCFFLPSGGLSVYGGKDKVSGDEQWMHVGASRGFGKSAAPQ
jgi:hypothetical protein